MARGWESKSVEDQIASAEERKTQLRPATTADERERQSRKTGLLLARTKILRDLGNARDDRHRALLQQSLDYINAQIAALAEAME